MGEACGPGFPSKSSAGTSFAGFQAKVFLKKIAEDFDPGSRLPGFPLNPFRGSTLLISMPNSFQLSPITNRADLRLPAMLELYRLAFPLAERRRTEALLDMIGHEQMEILSIQKEADFQGFVICWQLDSTKFIEHFAISPKARGQNLGSQALQQLLARTSYPWLLEVEPPTDTVTQKRITFYERNGFALLNVAYQQPAYRPDAPALPMLLMSSERQWEPTTLHAAIEQIHRQVYNYFPSR